MIGSRELYNIYIENHVESTLSLKKEITKLNLEIDKNYKFLYDRKYFINSYTTLQFETLQEVIEFKTENFKKTEKFMFPVLKEVKEKLKRIDEIGEIVKDKKEQIVILKKKRIAPEIFAYIITNFNEKIINSIVKGYKFDMCGNGSLRVERGKARKLYVDWNESNKKKKRVIEASKLPYKESINDMGETISNGGEKWLVYREDAHDCWIVWKREKEVRERLREGSLYPYYTIKFSMWERGLIKKLNKELRRRPETIRMYAQA